MSYCTVQAASEIEIVIQKSRFIGRCFPVQQQEEALQRLDAVCRQHWDARHNCYAYAVGELGEIARYSDDGEPGGTAGMPIMQAIKHRQVTNVLCVVTRYFGGILLGTGGLVRAYTQAAAQALEQAGIVRMTRCVRYTLQIPYSLWGTMENLLRTYDMPDQPVYAEQVTAAVFVPEERESAFVDQVIQKSDGRLSPCRGETRYRPCAL